MKPSSPPCSHVNPRYPQPDQFKTYGGWFTTVALRALAHHPESVRVTETCLRSGTILEVECHPDDQGTLIGDQRRVASAVHTLLHTLGTREGEEYLLRTVPPEEITLGDTPDLEEVDDESAAE